MALLTVLVLLAGCGSGSKRPQPAELGPNVALLGVRAAWNTRIGASEFPYEVQASGAQAPGHVFNLGHGVPPGADPAVLGRIVDLVHEASASA